MHHLLAVNKGDPRVRARVVRSLGGMYFRFFQDYPRAAFWWRQAGVKAGDPDSVALAECYWRLGNKSMAMVLLKQRSLRPSMIKLWGDMGETDRALQLAETYVPQQIIAKQGVKGVDMTSGATITAEAITNATAKALASGARK